MLMCFVVRVVPAGVVVIGDAAVCFSVQVCFHVHCLQGMVSSGAKEIGGRKSAPTTAMVNVTPSTTNMSSRAHPPHSSTLYITACVSSAATFPRPLFLSTNTTFLSTK